MNILFYRSGTMPGEPGGLDGCTYYRGLLPLNYLETVYGHTCWTSKYNLGTDETGKTKFVDADVVVLQRQCAEGMQRWLSAAMYEYPDKLYVYELDDNIDLIPKTNPVWREYHTDDDPMTKGHHVRYAKAMRQMVDLITVSTDNLRDYNLQFNPNVVVLPNSIQKKDFGSIAKKKTLEAETIVRIIWQGSYTHKDDLALVEEALRRICQRFPYVRVCIVGSYRIEGISEAQQENYATWVPLEKFYEFFATLDPDIGIAPLVDDPFNRSKSNIKFLEYSMFRLPTIASDVEPYAKSIRHNETGLIVQNTTESWYAALENLVLNKSERTRMGNNAHKDVLKKYDITKNVSLWHSTYQEFLDKKRQPSQ